MELNQLKERAIILLKTVNQLDKAGKYRFNSTIDQLNLINLSEKHTAQEKFKKILNVIDIVVSDAIKHYFMLDNTQRWLINLFLDDGSEPFPDKDDFDALINKESDSDEDSDEHDYQTLKDLRALLTVKESINNFLTLKTSPNVPSNVCLKNIFPDDPLFYNLKKDIDMGCGHSMILKKNKLIGTTALASCLCIIFIGVNKNGKPAVDLNHLSSSTVEGIIDLKNRFINNSAINTDIPIETFLLGGNLSTLVDNLQLISSKKLKITDYRLASSITETDNNESLSVVISGSEPNTIYYAYNQNLPQEILEQQPDPNNSNFQKEKELEFFQKSVISKKRAYNPEFDDLISSSVDSFFHPVNAKKLKETSSPAQLGAPDMLFKSIVADIEHFESIFPAHQEEKDCFLSPDEQIKQHHSSAAFPLFKPCPNAPRIQWIREQEENGDFICLKK